MRGSCCVRTELGVVKACGSGWGARSAAYADSPRRPCASLGYFASISATCKIVSFGRGIREHRVSVEV
eukprot:scaffold115958_cov42-Phaeocystis_antarctica.AAC.2